MDEAEGNRNRIAEGLQWTVFLLASTAMGLLWMPVVFPLAGIGALDPFRQNPVEVAWVLLTGLYIGLTVRWFARKRKIGPSLWLVFLLPLLGALGRISAYLMFGMRPGDGFNDHLSFFLFNLVGAYLLTGWLVIPAGVPYLLVLRLFHRRLDRWAASAKGREVRRFAWGFAALSLFAVVEGGRYHEETERQMISELLSDNGIEMSNGARFVAKREGAEFWGTERSTSFWFHDPKRNSWPPSPEASPVGLLEEPEAIRTRARRWAHVSVTPEDEIKQAQWRRGESYVTATMLRTKGGDYIEYRVPWQ